MFDWEKSPTWVCKQKQKYRVISEGFSRYHATLLDICLGKYQPDADQVKSIRGDTISESDIDKLAFMALVEFAASVKRQRKWDEDKTRVKVEPRPYDVYVMKTSFGSQKKNISVLVPVKGVLLWWDGADVFTSPSEQEAVYRIASLSETARVLQSLHPPLTPLSQAAMTRDMLHDVDVTRSLDVAVDPLILDPLNESQRQAVTMVASANFQDGFFAIQGPPGCGKTTTMVSMIAAISGGKIVTAPSNAAVANLGLKLVQNGWFSFPAICVFGDNCDPSVHFLNPGYRSVACERAFRDYEAALSVTPGAKEGKLNPNADRIRRNLALWLHVDENASMEELSMIDKAPTAECQILQNANVILCTLNGSGSRVLRNALSVTCHFQTFFLDEGGQSTEAEFFIATSFPGVKRIVVVGDPKQLRATVLEPKCASAGYGESWIGRVYNLHRNKVHLLDTQYRMDPIIWKFPNKRFYGDRILSGVHTKNREPAVKAPFRFIDTQYRGREELDEHRSYRNSYEVTVIQNLISEDRDIVAIVAQKPAARIIIITPYKAQAKLMRGICRSPKLNIDVSTVDAFQGQEGDIVILSTVRTKRVGFVDNKQRLNVALTRAKLVLRIVGDISFFKTLHAGSTLRALALHASKAGCVIKTSVRGVVALEDPPTAVMAAKQSPKNAAWKRKKRQNPNQCQEKQGNNKKRKRQRT